MGQKLVAIGVKQHLHHHMYLVRLKERQLLLHECFVRLFQSRSAGRLSGSLGRDRFADVTRKIGKDGGQGRWFQKRFCSGWPLFASTFCFVATFSSEIVLLEVQGTDSGISAGRLVLARDGSEPLFQHVHVVRKAKHADPVWDRDRLRPIPGLATRNAARIWHVSARKRLKTKLEQLHTQNCYAIYLERVSFLRIFQEKLFLEKNPFFFRKSRWRKTPRRRCVHRLWMAGLSVEFCGQNQFFWFG